MQEKRDGDILLVIVETLFERNELLVARSKSTTIIVNELRLREAERPFATPAPSCFTETDSAITRARLALFAGGSGDCNPVHIDIDVARTAGFDDVFAQGMHITAIGAKGAHPYIR